MLRVVIREELHAMNLHLSDDFTVSSTQSSARPVDGGLT